MRHWMIAAIIAGMASTAALAGDTPPSNASREKGQATSGPVAVRQIELAHAVADWGHTNGNAQALLVAVRLLDQAEPSFDPKEDARTSIESRAPIPFARDTLLAEAAKIGGSDAAIRAQIASLRALRSKGVINHASNGPGINYGRVIPARSHWDFTFRAAGGQPLRMAAIGDGRADIDMDVRDENGRLVCRDYAGDATPVCAITPAWTGTFTARIINGSDQPSYIRLIAN